MTLDARHSRRVLSNPSEGVLLEPWDVLLAGVGWWEAAGWGVVVLVVGVELPRFLGLPVGLVV